MPNEMAVVEFYELKFRQPGGQPEPEKTSQIEWQADFKGRLIISVAIRTENVYDPSRFQVTLHRGEIKEQMQTLHPKLDGAKPVDGYTYTIPLTTQITDPGKWIATLWYGAESWGHGSIVVRTA